jgi:hypothetical protein
LGKLARRSTMLSCIGLGLIVVRALALGVGFALGSIRYSQESPRDRQGKNGLAIESNPQQRVVQVLPSA